MERVCVVVVDHARRKHRWDLPDELAELKELARSAGTEVVTGLILRKGTPHPAYLIGKGKVQELALICSRERVETLIINEDLSGTQQKNIERAVGVKVIDRTQLILDIFALRARSNIGKAQVELAQLTYLLPRLSGEGAMLSRLGGGIGTRGPGEQKLELDRRRIRRRIADLRDRLQALKDQRHQLKLSREKNAVLTVALVGYTNAGKSTLLRALTGAQTVVADKLFSTLDTKARFIRLPHKQKVLFIDTVGFLHDLPHHLIEAFQATLEELRDADILIHVLDAANPLALAQAQAVQEVLVELDCQQKLIITALNKVDLLPEGISQQLRELFPEGVPISAATEQGIEDLISRVALHLSTAMTMARIRVPLSAMSVVNFLHENTHVLSAEYKEGAADLEVYLPVRLKSALQKNNDNILIS